MKNKIFWAHALAWIAVIVVNYFVQRGYGYPHFLLRLLVSTTIWFIFFYVNYLVLIPLLLFKKRLLIYVLASGVLLTGMYTLSKYSDVELDKKDLAKYSERLNNYEDVRESYETKMEAFRQNERRWRIHRNEQKANPEDSLPEERRMENAPPPNPRAKIDLTKREEEYDKALADFRMASRKVQWGNRSYSPAESYNWSHLFLLLYFYLAGLVLAFIDRSSKAEKKRSELESEKVAAELAYLKHQINPHFLFNTLNAIYSYTLAVSEPASDAVLKLSSILRYMLYETNKEKVPLSDEIAVVYDFIDLQKLRITDKTKVDISITGNTSGYQIEPMLLIPILENAFKFGVDSFEESFINIQVIVLGKEFIFNVSNKIVKRGNGDESNSGIGIRNIRRRLNLIYGENYSLTTEEKDGIFYVCMKLKLDE